MALSWNEIKDRALNFSKEWADTSNEEADAKPFLVEFFNVFGISSKRVSTFEHRVKKLDEKDGYIDLLWKGTILIEMKSRGKNLDKVKIIQLLFFDDYCIMNFTMLVHQLANPASLNPLLFCSHCEP